MYKKILVPLDGTKNDEAVLEHVQRLARETGAALLLIQLFRVIRSKDPFMERIQVEVGSAGHRAKEKAEVYLPELEKSIGEKGIDVSTEFLIVHEPEADEIVKYAQEHECDLIALTNVERTGLGSWFFSSIEEKVKKRSSLPVLMVAESTR
jgi:nucleotide-binding universal stress UspA family protein